MAIASGLFLSTMSLAAASSIAIDCGPAPICAGLGSGDSASTTCSHTYVHGTASDAIGPDPSASASLNLEISGDKHSGDNTATEYHSGLGLTEATASASTDEVSSSCNADLTGNLLDDLINSSGTSAEIQTHPVELGATFGFACTVNEGTPEIQTHGTVHVVLSGEAERAFVTNDSSTVFLSEDGTIQFGPHSTIREDRSRVGEVALSKPIGTIEVIHEADTNNCMIKGVYGIGE